MTDSLQQRQRDVNGSVRAVPYGIVAFGGSAGGIPALIEILALLPKTFPIPILVVQHFLASRPTAPYRPSSATKPGSQ